MSGEVERVWSDWELDSASLLLVEEEAVLLFLTDESTEFFVCRPVRPRVATLVRVAGGEGADIDEEERRGWARPRRDTTEARGAVFLTMTPSRRADERDKV